MIKIIQKASWVLVVFFAIIVGLYVLSLVFIADSRNEFVAGMLDSSFLGSFIHCLCCFITCPARGPIN
ncbi:MAG: hypothetical protein P8J61_00225 [Gammaproteobacteria bacterium]|nr:hypothetical protein [Gammaproteobacteria bacterium]